MKLVSEKISATVKRLELSGSARQYLPHTLIAVYSLLFLLVLTVPDLQPNQGTLGVNDFSQAYQPLRDGATKLKSQASLIGVGRVLDETGFRAVYEAHKRALNSWQESASYARLSADAVASANADSLILKQRELAKLSMQLLAAKKSFDSAFSAIPLHKRELASSLKNDKVSRHAAIVASIDSTHSQVKELLLLNDSVRVKQMFDSLDQRQERLSGFAPAQSGLIKSVFDKLRLMLKSRNDLEARMLELSKFSAEQVADSLAMISRNGGAETADQLAQTQYTAAAILFGLGYIPVLMFLVLLRKTQRERDEAVAGVAPVKPDDGLDVGEGFESLVAANGNSARRASTDVDTRESLHPVDRNIAAATDAPLPSTQKQASKDHAEIAREICHQLDAPLAFIEKNIEALCPILGEVHEAFDNLEQQPSLRKFAPGVAALSDSGTITELPFLVSDLQEGLRSARGITANVAELVTNGHEHLEVIELNQLLKTVLRSKVDQLRISTSIKLKLSPEPVEIMANPARMRHVIECLITNAIEAIDAASIVGGIIELHTSGQDERVKFTIRDNGSGMARDTLAQIFEPFFTTKKQKPGAGMGLAYVKTHVEHVGGKVELVSNPDKGTMARLTFPALSHELKVNREIVGEAQADRLVDQSKTVDPRRVCELSLNDVVDDVIRRKGSQISAKTTLSLGLTKDDVDIKAVPVDMRFLVSSLIDSFLKRGGPKTKLTSALRVTTQLKGDLVVLTVRDNAKLSARTVDLKQNQSALESISNNHDFVYVTRLVEDYNGRIDIANTSEGGAIVRVSLPKDKRLAELSKEARPLSKVSAGAHETVKAMRPSAEVISLSKSTVEKSTNDSSYIVADDEERYGDEGVVATQDKNWLTVV